jgi:hypothetical protein
MVDFTTLTVAMNAATAAIGLFDKMADQLERFITRSPAPSTPTEHRMKIESTEGAIVARIHGNEIQRISANDLKKLPQEQLRHISVYEKSMENYYQIWESVYPQLALVDSPVQEAKIMLQLKTIIRGMKADLEGTLAFLESCGLSLDDHYMHIRQLVAQV